MKNKAIPCPDCEGHGHINGGDEHSSWSRTCDRCHGTGTIMVPKTNADKIRSLTDEEQVDFIFNLIYCEDPAHWFCTNKKECAAMMAEDGLIPDEWCKKCMLEALQKPYKEQRLPSGIYLDKQESGLIEDD